MLDVHLSFVYLCITKRHTDEKSPSVNSWNGCRIRAVTPTTGFTTQNCSVAYKSAIVKRRH